jgi:YVTN family beta-propeller protein
MSRFAKLALLGIALVGGGCRDDQLGPPSPASPPAPAFTEAESGTFAYVANLRSDDVSIIRISDNSIVATVPVGDGPFGVAVTPDGSHVYVTNIFSSDVSVIRTSDNTVTATVHADGPHGVGVMPGGAFAYVANHNGRTMSVIRTSDNAVTAILTLGDNPYGMAFTPDGAYLYVTNTNSDNVSVVSTSDNAVIATVPVQDSPRGAAVSRDGAHIYVLNQRSNTISVIETSNNTVSATVPAGGNGPFDVAVTPDGAHLYVSNIFGNDVSVLRTSDNTVIATIPVSSTPAGVAITPDGRFVYVANQEADNLSVIRTSDNTVIASVPAGGGPSIVAMRHVSIPQAITFTSSPPSPARVGTFYTVAAMGGASGNPVVFSTPGPACSVSGSVVRLLAVGTCTITANQEGNALYGASAPAQQSFAIEQGREMLVYVANYRAGAVSILRAADNIQVGSVRAGEGTFGVAITPDGSRVYAANNLSHNVSVIQTSDNTVIATLPAAGPHSVAIKPGGSYAYVADHNSTHVSVFRVADNTLVTRVEVGANPYGLAFTPDGSYLYVANTNSADVSVIRTADNTVTTTLAVGASPRGVAVTPDGARVYILNEFSNSISVFRTADNSLVATIPAGNGPFDVAITPDGSRAYVTNIFGDNVSVIRTSDLTVIATIRVGSFPTGVAVTPDGAKVYVANQEGDNLTVIRTSDNSVSATVPTAAGPSLIAIGFALVPQTITFTSTAPSPAKVGTPYTVAATGGGSGNPVVFASTGAACSVSGSVVSFTAVGTCTIRASQDGNTNYSAARSAEQTFAVAKGDQTITITTSPPNPGLLAGSYNLAATGGGSGNAVTFSSLTPATCTVAGSTVTFVGVGACSLAADQTGSNTYLAAPRQTQQVRVTYSFSGFFQPVDNVPVVNTTNAGKGISLEFDLAGDQGLDILQGTPTSGSYVCTSSPEDLIEVTLTLSKSDLSYKPTTGRYQYQWRTEKTWVNSCRKLVITLKDGTAHEALFHFVK